MFADKVEIEVRAGKGGDGRMSFRHEKYRAKGGPDGGDGGRGGNVIFEASHNLNTLSAYRTKKQLKAGDGESGKANRSHGKNGQDVIVNVPAGTVVYDATPGVVQVSTPGVAVADLTADGQKVVIARGGRGGFGNAHFTSSTRQAPRTAELGEPGEVKQLTLELKLVADVGLVGLPNAGKSTLLSVISNAKPEIGDYPFTTLIPNLGVVDFENDTFLVADIPGLIEGASQGRGLGDEFLRHIERTAVILHLIDVNSDDIVRDYQTIQKELRDYDIDLMQKAQIVVLTKVEGLDKAQIKSAIVSLSKHLPSDKQPSATGAQDGGSRIMAISAQAHKGLDELLRAIAPLVAQARKQRAEEQMEDVRVVIDESSQPDLWKIEVDATGYRVHGQKIEGFARRTDWNNDASVERLRDILRKTGVARELERQGAQPGDSIHIDEHELEWL